MKINVTGMDTIMEAAIISGQLLLNSPIYLITNPGASVRLEASVIKVKEYNKSFQLHTNA